MPFVHEKRMSGYTCILSLALLFLTSQVDAECQSQVGSNTSYYMCTDGSIDDLDAIEANATSIRIVNIPIGGITESLFKRFAGSLKRLRCWDCKLNYIDDNAFSGFTKLEHVSLCDNNLTRVNATWFKDTAKLRDLHLMKNKIEEIEDFSFSRLTNLRWLRLEQNNLRMVNTSWFGDAIVPLKDFSISYNKIDDIKDNTFSRFAELDDLDLNGNNLTRVNSYWFGDSVPVKKLHVRDNNVDYVDIELIREAANLTYLDLSKNKLKCPDINDILISTQEYPVKINILNNDCTV